MNLVFRYRTLKGEPKGPRIPSISSTSPAVIVLRIRTGPNLWTDWNSEEKKEVSAIMKFRQYYASARGLDLVFKPWPWPSALLLS